MESPSDILSIFEARMAELGMTQSQLDLKAFGKPGNASIQNLKKGADPAYSRVAAMARALGLELYLGKPRRLGLAEAEGLTDFHTVNSGKAGYLPIPWSEPGPGKGSSPLALLGTWLDDHALIPDNLAAVIPDSSLIDDADPDGMVAVIDARAARHGVGQLWCLREGGKVLLARIAWIDDGYVIMPPRLDEAPRVIRTADAKGPRPLGRVACLLLMPSA